MSEALPKAGNPSSPFSVVGRMERSSQRRAPMAFLHLNKVMAAAGAAVLIASAATSPASSLTAELAKKCRELMVKAYPPAPAGSRTGNAQEQLDYFRTCVARDGKMDNVEMPTEGRGK